MEAVAAHALHVEAFGQRVMIGKRAMAAVERGVEAGDLRQSGATLENRADRREIVRLMERREWNIACEAFDHLGGHSNRFVVFRAAMDDAVPDCDKIDLLRLAQPCGCDMDCGRQIRDFVRRKHPVDRGRSVAHSRSQTRPYANSIDLALEQTREPARRLNPEQLELEAR